MNSRIPSILKTSGDERTLCYIEEYRDTAHGLFPNIAPTVSTSVYLDVCSETEEGVRFQVKKEVKNRS